MKALLLLAGAGAMLGGCGDESPTSPMRAKAAAGFPKAGIYDIVRDSPSRREETDKWVDASNRAAFETVVAGGDGSNCRDRQITIGGGTFSVRMTCDTHEGEIRGIGIERFGSYSESSIDITTETTLWGTPIRETAIYRLREGSGAGA